MSGLFSLQVQRQIEGFPYQFFGQTDQCMQVFFYREVECIPVLEIDGHVHSGADVFNREEATALGCAIAAEIA